MKPKIIGVLHLESFPKKPTKEKLKKIKDKALQDLSALQFGGVDTVIIENEFDGPKSPYGEFLNDKQKKIMFEIVEFLKPYILVPLGFCVLLNDYKTALLLAKKFGGKFIRVDTFVDDVERISDGIKIFPQPEDMMKFRKKIKAENIEIWADVHVKHTKLLSQHSLIESAELAFQKGASKIIVTGDWTGKPPKTKDLEKIGKILPKKSLVIGSGINEKNITKYKKYSETIIIGSAFKKNGQVEISNVHNIVEKNIENLQNKNLLLISSFSWDHIKSENKTTTLPGGPAYFITKVFKQKKLAYDIATSNVTHVKEKIIDGQSMGSEMNIPNKINLKENKCKNIVISTQLQEFSLENILKVKGSVYLDLQGYVSGEKFGQMKKFKVKESIWKKLDYIKCNEKEFKFLPKEFVEYIQNKKFFIVTKGDAGIDYYSKGKKYHIKTKPAKKISTTLGAGNTFWANFIYYNINSNNLEIAIKKAMQETKKFLENK